MNIKTEGILTVKILRDFLSQLPDDMPIATEGCDCTGPSDGAEIYRGGLIIKRNDALSMPWNATA